MVDPYIGKTLDGRYEVLERIGAGGMAIVYKAKDNRLNRLVAVKVLRDDLAQNEDFRRRFNAESQAVAQLSSPNIVSVYDVSRGGGTEFIVMELVGGITLKQYMERRGKLNWREALHFITQIMRGLAHAHEKGIVHRDIKPQNIMVLRDGSVKVADFGIACLENASQTLTQQALGSVHYISPEQARGERTDARSDIYSAGVVLYEMLTGRLPFEGESAVSVALQHLSSIPPNPRDLNPDIPEQMELICLKAMAPELDRRYPSSEAMIRDLEAFREDPELPLDFTMADLRPDAGDEPTRMLETDADGSMREASRRQGRGGLRLAGGQTQLLIFGGIAVVVVLAVVLVLRSVFGRVQEEEPPEQYVVMNVVGYTMAQARELEGVKGIFEVREEGSETSDDYPRGTIVRQEPAADRLRKREDLVIHVWLSAGEDTAPMPDVVNQTVAQAEMASLRDLIRRFGLTVKADENDAQYDNEIAEGYILSTIPPAGETLRKGDTVRLIISKGPFTWPLTNFVGMNLDLVKSQMDNLHLEWDIARFVYSDEEFGTILSQDPEAYTQVRDGTTVSFVVSRGPQSVTYYYSTSAAETTAPAAASTEEAVGTDSGETAADSVPASSTEETVGAEEPETVEPPAEPENRETVNPAGAYEEEREDEARGEEPSGEPADGGTEAGNTEPEEESGTMERASDDGARVEAIDDRTIRVYIPLPGDRETGEMEVVQDGGRQPIELVDCTAGYYPLEVTGHGETRVVVYLDGQEIFHDILRIGEDS